MKIALKRPVLTIRVVITKRGRTPDPPLQGHSPLDLFRLKARTNTRICPLSLGTLAVERDKARANATDDNG